MKLNAIASLSALLLFVGVAVAGQLPKGAAPLKSVDLRKIYSGKSAVWGNKDGAYFASNGNVKMVFTNYDDGKDRWTGYGEGTWSVTGNRICWNVSGVGKGASTGAVEPFRNHVACWEWYKAGPQYYTRWYQKWRTRGKNASSAYNATEMSKLRSGDAVSAWYMKYKAELKR